MEATPEAKAPTSTEMSSNYHLFTRTGISLEIMFEHPKFRSMSIYRMRLDNRVPLAEIKEDLKDRLHTQPPSQQWFYRGVLIPETSTLEERGVRENDKLIVKVHRDDSTLRCRE
ncbi:hypothetical protein BsWGS_12930 [Bradybaena similaris]